MTSKIDIESYALGETSLTIHIAGGNPTISRMITSDLVKVMAFCVRLNVNAHGARNAMQAFGDAIGNAIELRALNETFRVPECIESNHPHGWYRQFEKTNKRRNFR